MLLSIHMQKNGPCQYYIIIYYIVLLLSVTCKYICNVLAGRQGTTLTMLHTVVFNISSYVI